MLQTSFFKFSLTSYYSSSWDETSCSTSHCNYLNFLLNGWKKNIFWAARPKKYDPIKFSIFFTFSLFLTSDERALSGVSTPIKPIDEIFLPADICFTSSSIRKWSQIKNWTHELKFIFDFKSLTLPICCRPHFSSFPWHRITLRVEMNHPALRVTVII